MVKIEEDNRDFLSAYGLYTKDVQKGLLLSVDVSDFCHAIRASDGSELYVFCVRLTGYRPTTGNKDVWVYMKHYCPPSKSPFDLVISLHKLKYPIDLLFED